MQVRQEQIVLLAVALLVGLGWMTGKDAGRPSSGRALTGGGGVEAERFAAPRLASAGAADDPIQRALMSPPRDTRPLDPLPFEAPPRPPEPVLLPPLGQAPAPEHWARTFERPQRPLDASALFDERLDASEAALESSGDDPGGFRGATSWGELEASERMEAANAFRSIYDWLRPGEAETLFGRITNSDRYGLGLEARRQEPILFVQVDPFTGAERFPGQPPIEYTRDRAPEWGFADTLANRLEQRFAALPAVPTPGTYPEFLALANEALAARLEVPRALEIARDLFERARDYAPDEPAPAVGLARMLRAAFDIEPALAAFEAAAEKFPSRPEPWIGRAELLADLLLYEAAEASFRRAVQLDRGGWRARSSLGRYLLERGRADEALEFLTQAAGDLPMAADAKDARVRVRLDLARAQLGAGLPELAFGTFGQALGADAGNQTALAGRVACALAAPGAGLAVEGADGLAVLDPQLLVANAFLELDRATDGAAALAVRKTLERALELMPLHPEVPLRGLAWLAERAGQPELALGFAERALEASPTDVWSLYERGRLLRQGADYDGAAASLRAALERVSDFEHALFELSLVELDRGREPFAIRLLERCFELSRRGDDGAPDALPGRADALALIGVAELRQGFYYRAEEAFDAALAIDPDRLDARAGSAWCRYLAGEVEEATIQLRNLDDLLRNEPPEHPYRAWALGQIERIEEHSSKDIWADAFEYKSVGNGWIRDEGNGPQTQLVGGVAVLAGTFSSSGEARFVRRYRADEFIAIEASLRVDPAATSRAGLFVSRERQSSAGDRLTAFAGLARSRDGAAQVRVFGGGDDPGWIDLSAADLPFPAGEWVRIRIERQGDGSRAGIDIFLDGVPVLQGVPASGLSRGSQELFVGLFVEGDNGRVAKVEMDDVEITRRKL